MIKTFFLAVLPSLLPPVLVLSGLYFNIYLKGFYILHPLKTAKLMFSKDEKNKSPLAALSVSLAGALGVGNIRRGCGDTARRYGRDIMDVDFGNCRRRA